MLLWPALWALWLAGEGQPAWWIVVIFVMGTALMRSAGCAINDYADRDFDGHVERTAERPVASGRVSPERGAGDFRHTQSASLSHWYCCWIQKLF